MLHTREEMFFFVFPNICKNDESLNGVASDSTVQRICRFGNKNILSKDVKNARDCSSKSNRIMRIISRHILIMSPIQHHTKTNNHTGGSDSNNRV